MHTGYRLHEGDVGDVVEVTFRNIAMAMICSLIQHGFFPVFSIVGEITFYSNSKIEEL